MARRVFALVVGSGFAGSILAWVLSRSGRDVVVIDRGRHPRFAIGESSTPTADFLLDYLAHRWDLPELAPLAAFGSWRTAYPEIRCGLKRGFSYFGHSPYQSFEDTADHSHSMLVAASASEAWSDTQWYRADVDLFLARSASNAGARLIEQSSIEHANWDPGGKRWLVTVNTNHDVASHSANPTGAVGRALPNNQSREIWETDWIIDASGNGSATARWCGHTDDSDWMRTRSSAIFGHFDGVGSFSKWYEQSICDDPEIFDADDAAQHHLSDRGWFWMLRFLGDRTSVGFVDANVASTPTPEHASSTERWDWLLKRTPTVGKLLEQAQLVAPCDASGAVRLERVARMSRCRSNAVGDGWILLPVAYGFVDPLHSFGIAHSLSGIARIAEALLGPESARAALLQTYANAIRSEIDWFDTLISGSYLGLPSDRDFLAYASLYFVAAIEFEKQMVADPSHWPHGFLNAGNQGMRRAASDLWRIAKARHQHAQVGHEQVGDTPRSDEVDFVDAVRSAIKPWNHVGLLDPKLGQRLNHTAPPKRFRS
ncbi:MAG: NAD(P)/FAD-dependent oxidoreductase [Pirellula sp.]|jgi:FADH2 O2-dependent halogenase